ncbi:hypothetical protein BDY21DRAFT_175743 [Lineolata rhizophorae]|uniref:Uncharacterized protein n=1 Tax=Lineolata rhizophorae TaxID=578093 RepID=A0A6A6NM20_9PEZI|nr:hypothetical protein BDY21DRAFT_175743 [Lineolata rhizophorae]
MLSCVSLQHRLWQGATVNPESKHCHTVAALREDWAKGEGGRGVGVTKLVVPQATGIPQASRRSAKSGCRPASDWAPLLQYHADCAIPTPSRPPSLFPRGQGDAGPRITASGRHHRPRSSQHMAWLAARLRHGRRCWRMVVARQAGAILGSTGRAFRARSPLGAICCSIRISNWARSGAAAHMPVSIANGQKRRRAAPPHEKQEAGTNRRAKSCGQARATRAAGEAIRRVRSQIRSRWRGRPPVEPP